ncbi:hypothetical protein N657DRAFT_674127 [Parathielavia appendiculata]|uniref:Uncharacterized protein n=1 Tax=Parathielavia appendiculata TaxID=2587402 RepID=A0AAN6TU20_9PEZI|nr:hypothetical protein N657DRAFT_674127 [Parathielavia appendiculata]
MVKNGTRSGRARFRCAKGREYKPQANPEAHESKRRKTSTQFTSCKFQLAARPLPDGRWAVELPGGPAALHNHGWSDPTAFAGARADALAPFEQEVIKLSNGGSRPAQILAAIQAEQRGIHGQDIINLLQRHRQTSVEDRIEDCIVVAMTSVKGATANSKVTSTKLGLQRLRQVGRDSYEAGTAAPRASGRFIDGLDALDPDVEDDHDRALAAAEAAAREDQEDAVALGNQPAGGRHG